MIFKIADCEEELDHYFAIRHSVFVIEQGMFTESDRDEHDRNAIHLIAKDSGTGQVIGAVRCYPNGDGSWYGGRLAVIKDHRHGATGIGLVRKAVSLMAKQGCPRFLAHIQMQNVPYFLRLGWQTIGPPEDYHGLPHQLMEANLNGGRMS